MSKLGDIVTVPAGRPGPTDAAAILTAVNEDGTFNMRVLHDGLAGDEWRTNVDVDGVIAHEIEVTPPAAGAPAPILTNDQITALLAQLQAVQSPQGTSHPNQS